MRAGSSRFPTLHRQHFDDGLFKHAVATLGEPAVVDLIGVSG